jgi:hypothetical protein
MGKLVFIALVIGLAYAWHKGLLNEFLAQRAAPPPPAAASAQSKEPYDPYKRYEGADVPPAEQCAKARAKVRELEGWTDKNVKDTALEQTRQFIEDRCRGL